MPRENFISVAVDIQISFDYDEISATAKCNALSEQDWAPDA
jgi:hypothetical protein